jgi:hypothetical protein
MISITDPIQPALDHTKRILFEPFNAKKWFVLGFSAFLAQLGSGSASNFNTFSPEHTSRAGWPDFSPALTWISNHLSLTIALGVLLLTILLALAVLFQWLSSRGQFMFLDGVVQNRAGIVEPWTRLRELGNQLFRFRLQLLLAALGLILVCSGLGLLLALPDLKARTFGQLALRALIGAGGLLLLGLLAIGVIGALLKDFLVPIMYWTGLGTPSAWAVFRKEMLVGHAWRFVGFYLMNLLLWIPAVLMILLGCCLTCCIAVLPYLSSVAFLPIFVFFRCYSLGFLAQFGDTWDLLAETPKP